MSSDNLCNFIIPLPYHHYSHYPNREEDIGKNLVERGHGDEPGDNPDHQVYVKQDVPESFAVVERAEDLAILRYLHLCGG